MYGDILHQSFLAFMWEYTANSLEIWKYRAFQSFNQPNEYLWGLLCAVTYKESGSCSLLWSCEWHGCIHAIQHSLLKEYPGTSSVGSAVNWKIAHYTRRFGACTWKDFFNVNCPGVMSEQHKELCTRKHMREAEILCSVAFKDQASLLGHEE